MQGYIPPRPTGFTRESRSMQAIWDQTYGRQASTNSSSTVKSSRRSVGVGFRATPRVNRQDSFFPFKIYQFPSGLRKFQNADDWRRFKVHGGGLMSTSGVVSYATVFGTDGVGNGFGAESNQFDPGLYGLMSGYQVPPSTGAQVVPGLAGVGLGGWNEFSVTFGDLFSVWINLIAPDGSGGVSPCICAGQAPGSCLNVATGNTIADVWPTFPEDDLYHYMVGQVLVTNTPNIYDGRTVMVQQIISQTMLISPPYGGGDGEAVALRDIGTYNPSTNYFPGDVVSEVTGAAGNTFLKRWIYNPTSVSVYSPDSLFAPLVGVDPATHSPDPWILQSSSPLNVDYHTDAAYQAAKAYLRTA